MSATQETTVTETTTTPNEVETPARRRGRPRKATNIQASKAVNKRTLAGKPNKVETKSPAEVLAEREAQLRKKYKHIVEGSIKRHTSGTYAGKITIKINCASHGCESNHQEDTSDLFQVKNCRECTEAERQKRRSKTKSEKS